MKTKRTYLNYKQKATLLALKDKYIVEEISERTGIPEAKIRNYFWRNKIEYKRCTVKGGNKGLTPSEEKVIKLLCKGYSNQEIANKLYLSITTVKTHLNNIYQKYHLYNLTSEYSTLRLLCAFKYLGIKTDV